MKVLHVITSLHIGGAERLLTDIVPMMRRRGHQVDVLTFDGDNTFFKQKLQSEGVKVMEFGKKCNVYNPFFIFYLYQFRNKYDIIHAHLTSPQLFTAIACRGKASLVTTEHNTFNRRRTKKWYRIFDRWMYNRYKYVISISQETEQNLKNYLGNSSSCFITINNGIDVEAFSKAKPLEASIKATSKTIITMVAAFREQKDQKTLVRALKYLDTNKYEIWLVGDGDTRQEVENYTTELCLTNNIRFWGNRADVSSILKASDVVVMSSKWEGFGLSIVEGMAAGKPVIVSNVDGLSQVVGDAGLFFEVGHAEQLAKEIQRLASDNFLYSIMAKKSQLRAQKFDIKQMVNKYLDVYNICTNSPQ